MNRNTNSEEDCCVDDGRSMPLPPHLSAKRFCPVSGSNGKRVDGATIKAMLAVSLQEVRAVPYFFCRDADCQVVYFSEDGSQFFTLDQVRERVFQKTRSDDQVFVCYCFRHTVESIRAELLATNTSTVVDEINGGIVAGQCACDIRNPQGVCCLGNVTALIKALKQSLALAQ